MAYDYNKVKEQYEKLNDQQKQQFANDNSWQVQDFLKQYNAENNQRQTSNESNFNNGNGTNWQNQQNFDTPTENKTENQIYWKTEFDKNEQLDKSMFNQAPWQITVKEWTAQQTGKPDYQLESDARLNEMKSNLDQYFATSPRMFQDRQTFNKMFDYNNRESDAQRELLDSYWKRKQDIDNASKYTSWDGIESWMKDADITTDQLNYIKENSPEAYREWQQKQQDEINLRIANLATPADPTDNAELFNTLLQKLNLEPWDPYQIYDNWYNMAERLGVFSDSEKLKSYQNQLDQNHSKMESIMSRYAASTWWTVSDALAAARMQKALAPYQQREVDLQNSYTTLLNGRNSNLAIANQSATALAMQAQEDQRIWNQRLQGLGFAMTTAQYRSPEQQAQLKLQTASIQNDLNLLNQSKLNDLNRYNAYATAKMQNQLQAELTDLSVEDEAQLKANLNNVLSDYYKNYWDIIQRSQAQVVDDVIAYAKKNWISVAQALSENFIKPLQNKAEYKQKVASDYGMLSKQTITTINWKSVIMTTNPNWSISYQYIEDPDSATSTAKPYDRVDEKVFDTSPQSHSYYTLRDFIDANEPKNWETKRGWQCAYFVNNYLEKIWVGRYFWNEDIKTRASRCNSDSAKVWTIAVFDYNNISSDWINHGHVWIVVDTDENGYRVLESNFDKNNPEKIQKRYVLNWSSSCKGFFDPSKPASAKSSGELDTFEWRWNTYNLGAYSWWNDLTDIEKETVISLLTYQTDPSSLPKSWKDNWASNTRVRAAASAIGREHGYDEKQYYLIKNIEKTWDDKAEKGDISRNATSVSILKNLADSYWDLQNWDIKKINQWINGIKTEFWDKTTLSVASNMTVAAEEIAWALKWWASPSEQDTQRILDLFNGNLSNEQAQQLFKDFAKNLLDKNMTEADRFAKRTWYKPDPIYTEEVADRIYNDLWLTDLAKYYDYTPINAYTSWPKDQIDAIWKDAYENTYGISYDDVASLVNW